MFTLRIIGPSGKKGFASLGWVFLDLKSTPDVWDAEVGCLF